MSYNSRSPAVKRLMKEAQELAEPTELYSAHPLEDNLFEWHFTIRGPEDTPFHGGIYHGRILLPSEYPMKPPNILLLTPNGRFEVKRKICLSISGYHPESWRPCWSIRTALLAIIGFMPTHGGGAIGSLEFSAEERKKLAKESLDFVCSDCGPTRSILLPQTEASKKDREEAKTLASQIDFQGEKAKDPNSTTASGSSSASVPSAPPASTPSLVPAPSSAPTAVPQMPPTAFAPFPGDAAQAAAWSYYPYYYASMAQALPNGMPAMGGAPGMAAPLSFEQWLLQVKGLKGSAASVPEDTASSVPDAAAPPPAPTPAPSASSATVSTLAPNAAPVPEEPESELRQRKPPADTPEAAKEEDKEKEPEQEKEKVEEKEVEETEELLSATTAAAPEPILVTPGDTAEEWPMLSLFVICLLLLLVLLANRFLLPSVLNFFAWEE